VTGIAFEVTADWLLFRSDNPHHRSRSLPRQRFELGWHVRCALIGNYAVDLHLTWLFELNAETEPIGSFSCRKAVFFFFFLRNGTCYHGNLQKGENEKFTFGVGG
jgi:hypothetical protein